MFFDITNYLHELGTATRRARLFFSGIILHIKNAYKKSGNRDDCPICENFIY